MSFRRFAALAAAAATAAVAAWPGAAPAASVPATSWCGTDSASSDRRPDRVSAQQIGVIYAHPAGSADNFATASSKIVTDLAAVDAWWRREDPTRAPRFDLHAFPGCSGLAALDLANVTLPHDAAHYGELPAGWDRLANDLFGPPFGFSHPHKKYLVYYDGKRPNDGVCGAAVGNPFEGPTYAQVYLQSCYLDLGLARTTAIVAAHELLHTLGAVQIGAPHGCHESGGHVCDRTDDLMYPSVGDEAIDASLLDPGRDDYYGHSSSWFDLQDSFWLARLDAAQLPLTVTVAGPGRVASELPGIECPGACSIAWESGMRVALVPRADPGARFAGWKGACAGTRPSGCTVAMDGAAAVTATFTREPAGRPSSGVGAATSYRLSVTVTGSGRVVSTPSGISCLRSCSARFGSGSDVSLRAVARPGWRFVGWGASCAGSDECSVGMDANRAVLAKFARRGR